MQHTLFSPNPFQKPPLSLQSLSSPHTSPSLSIPPFPSSLPDVPSFPSHPPSPPPALAPLTHDGGPGHGAVLGPVVQPYRGDGPIPGEGDQRGDHELAALLGQEPRGSQGHRGHCQETRGKAWPRQHPPVIGNKSRLCLLGIKDNFGFWFRSGDPLGWGETKFNR